MPKSLSFQLTEEGLRETVKAIKHDKRPEVRQRAMLEKMVEQDPQELGYTFSIWTTERLRLHLKTKTGIELKPTQFKALLKENDFVYRRPKHDPTNLQDEKARQVAEEWLEELKKESKKGKSTSSLWTKVR